MSSPSRFKKLSVVELSKDFRKATRVVEGSLPAAPEDGQVFVKIAYAGINASDLNFTNGSYFKEAAPPFDSGFEAMGTVTAVAATGVPPHITVGQVVAFSQYGCFAEYIAVPAAGCVPVPDLNPEYLTMIVSGMTAAVALGELGSVPNPGDVVLVTAAAGGTGQFAVQLLKNLYGCTVIGTCSSQEKVEFLKSIGCDHAINYRTENLDARLKELAPKGLRLTYESVGGETFNTAVRNTGPRGRVIIIGTISSYKSGEQVPFHDPESHAPLSSFILVRSISLQGFFLPLFRSAIPQYSKQMLTMVAEGKLKLAIDKTKSFEGLEAIADAVDHLYTGESYGKIVVRIA